jgi:hypothetical protein
MHKLGFQFCVIDPEGDYSDLADAIVVGDPGQKPRLEEVLDSILTMGSPIIIYMVLAFWRNIRKYIWAAKRNPWYYL